MKILIVSSHFPPLNSIASLRPYSWAKYWAALGHGITVLTTRKPYSDNRLDADLSFLTLLEVPIPGVGLLRGFDDPANRSGAVRVDHAAPEGRWRLANRLNAMRRKRGLFMSARMPDHHDLWIRPALRAIRGCRWDLVVSSHGPYACHLIALRLKRAGRARRWIADFRDLWTDNHIFRGCFPFTMLERRLERAVGKHADALTTVSEPLARQLGDKYGDKVRVIENGVDFDDYTGLPAEPAFPKDGLCRIVHTGTIYQGKQDPSPLFEAMRRLRNLGRDEVECLRVIFAGRRLADAIRLAGQYRVADLVEDAGFVNRERALTMQRDADALLFLEFEAPGVAGILTGKLFEYLASGTEILGVGVSAAGSVGELVRAAGAGEMLGRDVTAIMGYLRRLLTEGPRPKQVHPLVRERFDRRRLAERMLAIAGD